MYNLSLVPCNSFNGKPIFKYIHLPKLVSNIVIRTEKFIPVSFDYVSTEQFWSTICMNILLAEIRSKYKLWIFKILYPSPICLFFPLESFSLYQEVNVFLAFIKMIVDITIAPLSVGWLTYFWRWAILIGSFELNINTRSNIFKSLQSLTVI